MMVLFPPTMFAIVALMLTPMSGTHHVERDGVNAQKVVQPVSEASLDGTWKCVQTTHFESPRASLDGRDAYTTTLKGGKSTASGTVTIKLTRSDGKALKGVWNMALKGRHELRKGQTCGSIDSATITPSDEGAKKLEKIMGFTLQSKAKTGASVCRDYKLEGRKLVVTVPEEHKSDIVCMRQ
jgi:hypothetical protein